MNAPTTTEESTMMNRIPLSDLRIIRRGNDPIGIIHERLDDDGIYIIEDAWHRTGFLGTYDDAGAWKAISRAEDATTGRERITWAEAAAR